MMFRSALAALALVATPVQAQDAPDLSRLTAVHRADLRCAATLAIVASEQDRGVASALKLPPLAYRGKEYFITVSARVMREAQLSKEQVRALLVQDVGALQQEAATSGNPDTALAAVIQPCLASLDREVAALTRPDLLQCAAIMRIAYDEVHAREGLSPVARDLAILSQVLTTREREALITRGSTGNEADKMLAEAHEAMLAEVASKPGGVERYDLAQCYELARPAEKSHF